MRANKAAATSATTPLPPPPSSPLLPRRPVRMLRRAAVQALGLLQQRRNHHLQRTMTALAAAPTAAAAVPQRHDHQAQRSMTALAAAPTTAAAAADAATASVGCTLEQLEQHVDNTFVRELPGDEERMNFVRQVVDALFSRVEPTPTGAEPTLVAYAADVARLVGLEPAECERPEFALCMAGAAPLPGAEPYAACYGGHQFRQWAGQLGDGRAITLAEVVNPKTKQRWELQLKGAGRTPYSRRADGRAVLRSSLREFVASEAMAALGVPTTRALSLVATGDEVLRDMFYNGNARMEPGAVVCRVAPSFVRFGNFQLPVSRGGVQTELCRVLLDYVIRHHYPELLQQHPGDGADAARARHTALLAEVCRRTGVVVGLWQAVGFVHGVLNTDNMSILGLTIDYGPFGFMDALDPRYTPNTTDFGQRIYCYQRQPEAGQFNCLQLANALYAAGLVDKEDAETALEGYAAAMFSAYHARMAARLGLREHDGALLQRLLELMVETGADFTNTLRALAFVPGKAPAAAEATGEPQQAAAAAAASGGNGGSSSSSSQEEEDGDAAAAPEGAASAAEALTEDEALAAARAAGLPERLLAALAPGALAAGGHRLVGEWAAWLRLWRAALAAEGTPEEERMAMQRAASPKFIPRQHLLQGAIDAAERGDYAELSALLDAVGRPYDERPELDARWSAKAPPGSSCVLSCSS